MKILFIASDNSDTSGAFLCMVELCVQLREKFGIESLVVLPYRGSGESLLNNYKIKYKLIYSFSWLVAKSKKYKITQIAKRMIARIVNFFSILRIRRYIREQHIDVVHINTTCTYVGAVAAKKENVKLVWHLREFLEEHTDWTLWNRPKNNKLIGTADKIIVISKCLAKKYENIFLQKKLKIIYDGIDVNKYQIERELFQGDIIQMIFVGALYKDKGVEDLIDACGILKEQKKLEKFCLHIYGKGEKNYEDILCQKVRELHLDKEIIFQGTTNEIEIYTQQADISFTCSKAEAFGRVTVEALMSGCLVIGAKTAATAEIIQDGKNGLLYSYGNVEELAEKIQYALDNKSVMREIARYGKKSAQQQFSLEKNVLKVHDTYKEILEA